MARGRGRANLNKTSLRAKPSARSEVLDGLIDNFKEYLRESEWEEEEWSNPDTSPGLCYDAAYKFEEHCIVNGVVAEAVYWEYIKNGGRTLIWGDTEAGEESEVNEDLEHMTTLVHISDGDYVVDFTASQFNFKEFPRVTQVTKKDEHWVSIPSKKISRRAYIERIPNPPGRHKDLQTYVALVAYRQVGEMRLIVQPNRDELRREAFHDFTAIDGPYFHSDTGGEVFYIAWIETDGHSPSHGAFEKFIQTLKDLKRPVYTNFTNKRLQQRFNRLYKADGFGQFPTIKPSSKRT